MNLSELPGSELILPGLDDLHNGKTHSIGALLVAIASTRLTAAGLDIPKDRLASEPELALYAHLQDKRDNAYPYYNALLNSLNAFVMHLNSVTNTNKLRAKTNLFLQSYRDSARGRLPRRCVA
jgi:hypothetical protein